MYSGNGKMVGLWQKYLDVFKCDKLLESKSIYTATAEKMHSIIYNECLNRYEDKIRLEIGNNYSHSLYYFDKKMLKEIHFQTRNKILHELMKIPKIGDTRLISNLENDIKCDIEIKFSHFKNENERNRKQFIKKMEFDCRQVKATFKKTMRTKIGYKFWKDNELLALFNEEKFCAMEAFELKLRGDNGLVHPRASKRETEVQLGRLYTEMEDRYVSMIGSTIGMRYGGLGGFILGGIAGSIIGVIGHVESSSGVDEYRL